MEKIDNNLVCHTVSTEIFLFLLTFIITTLHKCTFSCLFSKVRFFHVWPWVRPLTWHKGSFVAYSIHSLSLLFLILFLSLPLSFSLFLSPSLTLSCFHRDSQSLYYSQLHPSRPRQPLFSVVTSIEPTAVSHLQLFYVALLTLLKLERIFSCADHLTRWTWSRASAGLMIIVSERRKVSSWERGDILSPSAVIVCD